MSLPKYFKDASGFCYSATEQLAKLSHLTPWDGAVDARGFATDAPQKPADATSKRVRRPRVDAQAVEGSE